MMKKNIYINKLVLVFFTAAVLGFCIITNTSGDYRAYLPEDLPFIIQLNENTPNEFKPVVDQALLVWNNVEGSYFEFQRGADTEADGVAADGVNLLYFDANYDNFEQGSNTIAFSSTFTSTVGGFHAVESDYIYNAGGYPPAIDGSSNQMDLWTITMHEVGHHMGLSHNGDDGNSSGAGSEGCGINLPSSVMYWSVGFGQIKHELDPHDEMGAVAIYPNYEMQINVTDSETGNPLENAKVVLNDGAMGAVVGDVQSSLANGRGLRAGEVYTEVPTDEFGSVNFVMNKAEFSFDVFKFGYQQSPTQEVSFPQPFDYGDTQFLSFDFELEKAQSSLLNGTLTSEFPEIDINAEVVATWVGDEKEFYTTVSDDFGNFTLNVPQDYYYNVAVFLNPPYEYVFEFDSVYVDENGVKLDIELTPTKLLLVNSEETENLYVATYMESLTDLGIRFSYWDETSKGNVIEQDFMSSFTEPYAILWNAGGESSSGLDSDDKTFLINHLEAGNGLILTGDNIAENTPDGDALLNNYFGVQFRENLDDLRLRGFQGDVLGDSFGASFSAQGKDLLDLTETNVGDIYKSFYVGTTNIDSANIIGVRSEGGPDGWKAFFMSVGIHHLFGKNLDTLMYRSVKYVLDTTFVSGVNTYQTNELPNIYSISQNYPNPFNPSTTIKFALPVSANVRLTVYNILGQQVEVLKDEMMNSGSYELRWDATASSISSGIYFYRIEADGINGSRFAETKKMILLK